MAIINTDGSIVLTTKVDQSGLKKGMSTMKSGVASLIGSLGKLAAAVGVAFSVSAIVKFSKESSDLATTTEASVQRLIDIYGSASKAVGDFIDANANALGMSRSSAASYASIYGNLFSVWADQKTNAELTNHYLNMIAVVASKTGRTVADVQERINSGLLGNTEAIEDLGIFVNVKTIEMTDAFQRMANGKSWEQLDAYAQQQIRTMAILEQATSKYGNEVLQTTALTKSQFHAAWQDFQATWGEVVNRVLMPVLEVLTEILIKATDVMRALFKISGSTVPDAMAAANATSEAVSNQEKLTEAVKETKKANDKALAGFDDIQILTSNAAENTEEMQNAAENVPTTIAPIETTTEIAPQKDTKTLLFLNQIYEELKRIADLFMGGFWHGFGDADFSKPLESLRGIGKQLMTIAEDVAPSAKKAVNSFIYAFGQMTGSFASIGTTIATNVLGGIEFYLTENSPYITERVAGIFDAAGQIATHVGNLWSAFAHIFSAFAEPEGVELTGHIVSIFSNAFLGVVELSTKFGRDFIGLISTPINDNKEELRLVLQNVLGFFNETFAPIDKLVTETGEKFNKLYDEHVAPTFESITKVISGWVKTFTDAYNKHIKPVLERFSKKFTEVVEEHVTPMIDKAINWLEKAMEYVRLGWENVLKPVVDWVINVLVRVFAFSLDFIGGIFNTLLEVVSDVIGKIMDVMDGLLDFVIGTFTGDWERAWSGLKDIFAGIINGIIAIFEGCINLIIDGLNSIIRHAGDIAGAVGGLIGLDWGISEIPSLSLPRLAQGAVIPANREFLAVLGDQRQGTNVETPLSTMIEAFQTALDSRGGYSNGNIEVVLELDGREFGRAVVDQGNQENRRIGTRLVIA